ncbi:unnamed protein product [Penicillium salamii]|uniref:Uncharacterized protein n=1 Tax=Penicillium salamii TaxID=1612424 RepID=A0A9W4N2C1_9EURO|nr:unnamed protein product [Penicillium salamii]
MTPVTGPTVGGGGGALQAASFGGYESLVEILLQAGADVNAQGGEYGNALQAAALNGSPETVQILLGAGADVNAQGGEYGNALQAAAWRGSPEIVQILLGAGADVNVQGGEYGNALQAAAYNGSPETVQILLGAGADVNALGGEYGNALQAAAWRGSPEIVQILLGAGADVNVQGGEYGNALQAAAYNGSPETVQILLGAGADVNARGGEHGSPLLAAIHEGYADEVQILLRAGADSLLKDKLGRTPLHIAASKNMLHIFRLFPQLASALNNYSDFLQTPLHLAVCHGHIRFAIALLNSGADPSLPDGYGRHIMDWASHHETLLQEIQNHCSDLVLTPPDTQEMTLILQQLSRYFLFLGQFNNARYLFQLHLRQGASSKTDIYQISCNIYNQIITGTRFVCRLCVCIDLCSSCLQKYPYHSRLHPNLKHKVFEVSNVPTEDSQFTGVLSDRLTHFLSNIAHKNTRQSANQSEIERSNDSVTSLPLSKAALVRKVTFSLVTIGFAILFGVSATFLGVWYF